MTITISEGELILGASFILIYCAVCFYCRKTPELSKIITIMTASIAVIKVVSLGYTAFLSNTLPKECDEYKAFILVGMITSLYMCAYSLFGCFKSVTEKGDVL